VTPSWYDVLDVPPDATAEEIRAAWRAGVADLDPTDRRFKRRNAAAEVLLDPDRRADHDADLAADAAAAEPDADDDLPGGDPARDGASGKEEAEDTEKGRRAGASSVLLRRSRSRRGDGSPAARTRTGVPRWMQVVPAVLGVLAVVLVVLTVVVFVQRPAGTSPAAFVTGGERPLPDDREVAAAQSAAESAVVPILSFDYRRLDDDKAAAEQFMTDSYRDEYSRYFAAAVEQNAPRTKTVVNVQLLSSGIVRTGPGQVDVLTFVNRPTRNAQSARIFRDQVVLRMVEQGDAWLVDCLITTAGGTCGD